MLLLNISKGSDSIWNRAHVLMLREAQLDQVLATGSKASQFFNPFCPQGSDPPTTYSLLLREQTPAKRKQTGRQFACCVNSHTFWIDAESLTCVAAVRPQLWHLNPFISQRIVSLSTAQLIRMSVRTSNHVQLALAEVTYYSRVARLFPLVDSGKSQFYHKNSHLESSPRSSHGCNEAPAVPFGVVTLHSPQTLLSVVASWRPQRSS